MMGFAFLCFFKEINRVFKFLFKYLINLSLHFHPLLNADFSAISPVIFASSIMPSAFVLKACLNFLLGMTANAQLNPGTLNVLDAE